MHLFSFADAASGGPAATGCSTPWGNTSSSSSTSSASTSSSSCSSSGGGGGGASVAASFEEWPRGRCREKEERRREKEEKKGAKEERRAGQSRGGGVRAEEGEVVVPEGGDEDGEGDEVQVQPPPPQPPVLPLPEWLQKAFGKDPAVCRKAAAAPWSAQVLEQGCGPDQPIFSDPSKGHYTLRWVMRRLFRCLIRKHGEGKGEWRRDAAKGGGLHWQPVPGGPMSPLPERISSGSLGALNLLSDPRGVRFGTGHYLVCLEHRVALGSCQQWRQGKSVQFAPVWSALLSLPTPPYDPAAQHTYEGLVPGSRTTRGLAAVTQRGPLEANTAPATNAANPVEAPSPASSFMQAMGVLYALGCPEFQTITTTSPLCGHTWGR